MYLIVGSTGTLGGTIATMLSERGAPVRAMIRAHSPAREHVLHTSPARLEALGADVVEGDLTRPETLVTALDGVTHVISTATTTKRGEAESMEAVDVEGTATLARLAAAAGIRQFMYVSALQADADSDHPILREKGLAERGIAASGVPATVLRPAAFMQDWIGFALGAQLQATAPSGAARVQLIDGSDATTAFVDETDVAKLAVAALDREDTIGETIPLAAELARYPELVERMQRLAETPIALETLPVGGKIDTVPAEMAGMLTFMLTIKARWPEDTVTTPEVAERFGFELTSIDAFLERALGH